MESRTRGGHRGCCVLPYEGEERGEGEKDVGTGKGGGEEYGEARARGRGGE